MLSNIHMKSTLKNMAPLEIAEYSWREGHRQMAKQLMTMVRMKFPDMQPSRIQELTDLIKEDEDRACAAFLAFMEAELARQSSPSADHS